MPTATSISPTPTSCPVPVAGLIDPAYLAQRSALIAPDRDDGQRRRRASRRRAPVGAVAAAGRAGHVALRRHRPRRQCRVADLDDRKRVRVGADGQRLLPQQRADRFQLRARASTASPVANRVEAGKRPRSSMSPTIVFGPDGRVRLAVGAAGGATIIAQVAKAIIGVIDWRLERAGRDRAAGALFAPGDTVYRRKGQRARSDDPRADRARPQGRGARAGLQGQCDRMGGRPLGRRRRSAQRRHERRRIGWRHGRRQQLEHFPNLVTMFLTRAREKGDTPFLSAKRDGAWQSISYAEAARQVAALADSLKRHRAQARRPRHAGQREPPRMADRRPRRSWPRAASRCRPTPPTRPAITSISSTIRARAAVIVSTQKLARALMPAVLFASDCHHIISIDDIITGQSPDVAQFHHVERPRRGRGRHRRARSADGRRSGATTSPA